MKKSRQKKKDFDHEFERGKVSIDFSSGVKTEGLSKIATLPPMTIPGWLALEIERLSKRQANSKAAIVRQLLVEAIEAKRKIAMSV